MILPKGWEWTTLDNISLIILGQSPPSSTYNTEKQGLPFYQGKLDFGEIYPTPSTWCLQPKKIAEKGDVFISVRAPVGPTNICPEKSAFGRGLAAIRGLGGIDSLFILYLMRSIEKSWRGTGTTFDAIGGDILRKMQIMLPPIAEQHRIVRKVEELFTRLDAGLKALRTAKLQLKQHHKSLLKYAFQGTLTETWREANDKKIEPTLLLLERLKQKRTVNSNSHGQENQEPELLPNIPNSWAWTTIGTLFDVKPGGTPSRRISEYWSGNIPWVSSGEVANKRIKSTAEYITEAGVNNSSAKVRPPGTVLLAMIGEGKTRGQAAILDIAAATNQNVASILCAGSEIPPQWIFYWLLARYDETRKRGSGGMQPALNADRVRMLPIPLAPIAEQEVIIQEIERQLSIAENTRVILEAMEMRIDGLRHSILKLAFDGKLISQDPSDEPATVLLQKIGIVKAKLLLENEIKGNAKIKGKDHRRRI